MFLWPVPAHEVPGRSLTVRNLNNEQKAACRGGSCEADSFDVRRHLSTILIFSLLDLAVGFEIDYGPALEFRRVLLKSKIDHALYERAILAIVLEGCFPS